MIGRGDRRSIPQFKSEVTILLASSHLTVQIRPGGFLTSCMEKHKPMVCSKTRIRWPLTSGLASWDIQWRRVEGECWDSWEVHHQTRGWPWRIIWSHEAPGWDVFCTGTKELGTRLSISESNWNWGRSFLPKNKSHVLDYVVFCWVVVVLQKRDAFNVVRVSPPTP